MRTYLIVHVGVFVHPLHGRMTIALLIPITILNKRFFLIVGHGQLQISDRVCKALDPVGLWRGFCIKFFKSQSLLTSSHDSEGQDSSFYTLNTPVSPLSLLNPLTLG